MNNQLITLNTNTTLTMSSREIAELTGKRHDNVMADIRNMLDSLNLMSPEFSGIMEVPMPRGGTRSVEVFNLPKDLTITLVSGYNVKMRYAITKRWMELEEQAKGAATRVPQSFPEALRLAAELAEKNEQLALENKEMAPKAVVFDNCMALRQESLATFVRTLEGVNTMAITDHRSHSTASKSTASTTGARTSGLKSFP